MSRIPGRPWKAPRRGYVEGAGYSDQPPDTTPLCLNVRAFQPGEDRFRLSQRDGMSRYIDEAVNGTSHIQQLSHFAQSLDSRSVVRDELLFQETFTGVDGTEVETTNPNYTEFGQTVTIAGLQRPNSYKAVTAANLLKILGNKCQFDLAPATNTNNDARGMRLIGSDFEFDATKKYIFRCNLTTFIGEETNSATYIAGLSLRIDAAADEYFECLWERVVSDKTKARIALHKSGDPNPEDTIELAISSEFTTDALEHDLEVRVNEGYIEIWFDGERKVSYDASGDGFTSATHIYLGWVFIRRRSGGT